MRRNIFPIDAYGVTERFAANRRRGRRRVRTGKVVRARDCRSRYPLPWEYKTIMATAAQRFFAVLRSGRILALPREPYVIKRGGGSRIISDGGGTRRDPIPIRAFAKIVDLRRDKHNMLRYGTKKPCRFVQISRMTAALQQYIVVFFEKCVQCIAFCIRL